MGDLRGVSTPNTAIVAVFMVTIIASAAAMAQRPDPEDDAMLLAQHRQAMSVSSGLARGGLTDEGLSVAVILPLLDEIGIDLLAAHPGAGGQDLLDELQGEPAKTRGGHAQQVYRDNVSRVAYIRNPRGSSGAGMLISGNRRFITNYHVVEGAQQVLVFMHTIGKRDLSDSDGLVAQVIAHDVGRDLALIELGEALANHDAIKLANEDTIEVGNDVYAIGHPLGLLWSFTTGVVSQVRPGYEWLTFRATVIQTQTPINPGNSGGPLFNADGEVIGVNSFIASESEGLNFAVSVSEVRAFLDDPTPAVTTDKQPDGRTPSGPQDTRDLDGDGHPDVFGYDSRDGGLGDVWLYDTNGDGSADALGLDLNGNGRPDTLGYDQNGDGIPDLFRHDSNEDGVFDIEGFDLDGDGRLDKVRRISADRGSPDN